jgi:hypothetical protein
MYVQAVIPGDTHCGRIVSNGCRRTQFGCREHALFTEIALAGTQAFHPSGKAPDLIRRVEFRDF